MNNNQRKALREQIQKLEKAQELLNAAKEMLVSASKGIEDVKDAEDGKMYNMGEALSYTSNYRKIEELSDKMGDVMIDIDIIDTDDMCNDIRQCIINIDRIIAA